MAETYYIRLPFYLLMASVNRSVDITFDGTLISTAEISATSRDSMDNVTFSVTKDPGTYLLKIKPVAATETEFGLTSICLDDVWVSNNNSTFYSVLLNIDPINKTPIDPMYGFNPALGATLWNDSEFTLELNLPDAANWNKTYYKTDLTQLTAAIADLETSGSNPADLEKCQAAKNYFIARGFS